MKTQLLTLAAFAVTLAAPAAFAGPLTEIQVGGKTILANSQGRTVYTYDPDNQSPGKSVCNGGCAVNWPPVAAPAGNLNAPLSAVTRSDGSAQLAFNGKPLYLFKGDSAKGDIKGNGLAGIWHIVPSAGLARGLVSLTTEEAEPSITPLTEVYLDDGREVLATDKGLTVYSYDPDLQAPGKSVCNDECAAAWPPVLTTLAAVEAPLSIVTRDDGSKQLAYEGKPLYLYVADTKIKDAFGDGLGGVWHIVTR